MISYFDLNSAGFSENYSSYNCNTYGGGRIFAAAAKQHIPNFHLFAKSEGFQSFTEKDNKENCHVVSQEQIILIRNGGKVCDVIPEAKDSDIFVHHDAAICLNLDGCKSQKQVCWPLGWSEAPHPSLPYLIFFDLKIQQPRLQHNNHKIYHAVIGPPVEPFQERVKSDLLFQCHRHTRLHQSIFIAQMALKYGIQTYFAGPVDENYDLLKYINNKTTHYLGIIGQETKNKYNKLSKGHFQLQTWPVSLTLSAKEAQSYNVPVFAAPVGGFPEYIKEGINGGFVNNEQDFINLWQKRDSFKQLDCYNAMLPHSESKMVESFSAAFEQIINEN